MSTKHTPGEWTVKDNGIWDITIEAGGTICHINNRGDWFPKNEGEDGRSHNQMLADARLIAAAPEMLDCLTGLEYDPTPIDWISALLCEFERHYQPEIDDDPDATSDAKMHVRRFIEKARNAVKKAEGSNYTNADAEREERILEDIESRTNYDRF